jgi:hypothetical protein
MSNFSDEVQEIVGPQLSAMGFVLDQIDDGTDGPDGGGRALRVVYYRGSDVKIQIYESIREGETNCMIGALDAPNEWGLRNPSKKWQYFTRFVQFPDLPLKQLVKQARANYDSYANPLFWVLDRIEKHYEAARAGILEMNKEPEI